ncbi:matrix metalloproteinase-11 [Rhodoplanes roseus]|uniref:Matrix metalloproteinase-11 n=1 Tax=Rhodoplanes roseus TaxID=29409 RepID=A0A327L5J1_9BRAD|nr:matrix metalloproteinase-11 [Rhodoplanes roseus]
MRDGVRCETEKRGHSSSRGRSPLEIIVDASEGFIPLWDKGTTLRWKFRNSSLQFFENPEAAKGEIEVLLGEAILAWGDAAPVKFAKREDAWDFEIVVKQGDNCNVSGCVLASAFFPDAGRHVLSIYPKMFTQSREEQVETLVHEIGHVFGLRHFFAQISETEWPSQIFGKHQKFSIMNYGSDSRLTAADRQDLKRLYDLAWAGQLKAINGTPIRFMRPFHASGVSAQAVMVGELQPVGRLLTRPEA